MRTAIVTKKQKTNGDLKNGSTTAEVLVHGINYGRSSVIVEYSDGQLCEEPIANVHFTDKPQDAFLTEITATILNGIISYSGDGGSIILHVKRAVEFAREIILQTK